MPYSPPARPVRVFDDAANPDAHCPPLRCATLRRFFASGREFSTIAAGGRNAANAASLTILRRKQRQRQPMRVPLINLITAQTENMTYNTLSESRTGFIYHPQHLAGHAFATADVPQRIRMCKDQLGVAQICHKTSQYTIPTSYRMNFLVDFVIFVRRDRAVRQ